MSFWILFFVNVLSDGIVAVSVATVIAQGFGVLLIVIYIGRNKSKIFNSSTNAVRTASESKEVTVENGADTENNVSTDNGIHTDSNAPAEIHNKDSKRKVYDK